MVISVAATPNCSLIAATTVGRSLYLLNRDGEHIWKKPKSLDHEGWAVALSHNARIVAVGTASKNPGGGSIYAFDCEGHQLLNYSVGAPVWGLDVAADGGDLVATSWNNHVYRFKRVGQRYLKTPTITKLSAAKGLYGVHLLPDSSDAVVAAYDAGLVVVDEYGAIKETAIYETGIYNVTVARDTGEIFAGCREGKFASLNLKSDGASISLSKSVTPRPICGVSATSNGKLLFVGSFDGNAYLVNHAGKTLWSVETDGEVWSTACSTDGSLVCLGSGDHSVRIYENVCNTASYHEIELLEASIYEDRTYSYAKQLDLLVTLYLKYGLVEYGYNHIRQMAEDSQDFLSYDDAAQVLLSRATHLDPNYYWAHFELGKLRMERNEFYQAACHFQKSAHSPNFYTRAMNLSAEAFSRLQLKTATSSCFRRAREQHLNSDAMRVLYNLGRSYEDGKQWREALSCYELIVSWDGKYRNTWERLQNVKSVIGASVEDLSSVADYTGLTISLLGPDTPRDVDQNLQEVIAARTSEVLLRHGERQKISDIVNRLLGNESYCRGITGIDLDYTTELFLKYDYALPEDETKKFLETVNLFFLIPPIGKDMGVPQSTLDIGSATGRYPMLFSWLGTEEAHGIDIEERAVEYARAKAAHEQETKQPLFEVCDARDLLYRTPKFDLVTCMMGTFAHIPRADHLKVVTNVFNCLNSGGGFAISTWDLECEHLSFLSIYSEIQKEQIRANSPTQGELYGLFEAAGYRDVEVRPFCMLPQVVTYDLGLAKMRSGDIQLSAQADLAMRALYPDKHGEMFIAFGRKLDS